MKQQFYVLRTHSHTDRQQLWKVMSRPMQDLHTARGWADYCKDEEKNPNHEFFVVSVVSEEVESTRPVEIDGVFYNVPPAVQDELYRLEAIKAYVEG